MAKPESSAQKGATRRWFALRPRIVIIGLFLIAAVLFLNWYAPRSLEADRSETMAIGDEIVEALDRYFSEHGRYPNSFDALVPKYLDKIKAPIWGEAWQYESYPPNGDAFELKVGYKDWGNSYYPVMYYISTEKKWLYDS